MWRFLRYVFVLIVFIIVFPLGLLVLLSLLQRRRDEYTTAMMNGMATPSSQPTAIEIPADILAMDVQKAKIPYLKPETATATGQVPADATPLGSDDLRRIEGIGPKVSDVLRRSGISSFSQLAATGTNRLREILEAEKLAFINPETWPDQATLAAQADWEQLKALQSKLKGGRRS